MLSRSACIKGGAQRRAPALLAYRVTQGLPAPAKKAPGGTQSPLYLYPETNKKLHPNVQLRKGKIKKREPPLAFLPALCYTLFKYLSKY